VNTLGISEPGNCSSLVWRWLLLWPTPYPRRKGWFSEGAENACRSAKQPGDCDVFRIIRCNSYQSELSFWQILYLEKDGASLSSLRVGWSYHTRPPVEGNSVVWGDVVLAGEQRGSACERRQGPATGSATTGVPRAAHWSLVFLHPSHVPLRGHGKRQPQDRRAVGSFEAILFVRFAGRSRVVARNNFGGGCATEREKTNGEGCS